MKSISVSLLCLFFLSVSAQENDCASAKMRAFGNSRGSVIDSAHTAREGQYDVRYYKLDVDVERDTTYISGNVMIAATVTEPLDTFALELHPNLTVDSTMVNGSKAPFVRINNSLDIIMPQQFGAGTQLSVMVYYHGTPPADNSAAIGNGFNTATRLGLQITWNLSEPYSAYEWWPCKQALEDKADSSEVDITTDSLNLAGSNGLLVNVASLAGGKKIFKWKSHFPIDYYLISVAVAPYIDHSIYAHPEGADSILIQNYVYNSTTVFPYLFQLDSAASIMELFCKLYGLYPFHKEKYGHCQTPIGGGMEHQTMTTLGSFAFNLIAHEMTHQWFGDNITCATWKDIWLNEGFASYGEYLAQEYLRPGTEADYMQNFHNPVLVQSGGSVYCTDTTSVSRIFNSVLTYKKGGAALHTLRYIMGDSLFFGGLKYYQQQFAGGTATTDDLRGALEQYSGMDLFDFFDQWIYGQGFPTYNVKWYQAGGKLYMQVNQTTSMPGVTPLFTVPVPYKIQYAETDTTIKLTPGASVEEFILPVNGTVKNVVVDPDNWIVNKDSVVYDSIFGFGVVSQMSGLAVNLYPNPVAGQLLLWIQSDEVGTQAQVYSADGKRMGNFIVTQGTNIIETGELPNGVYLLKLTGGSGNENRVARFIKR